MSEALERAYEMQLAAKQMATQAAAEISLRSPLAVPAFSVALSSEKFSEAVQKGYGAGVRKGVVLDQDGRKAFGWAILEGANIRIPHQRGEKLIPFVRGVQNYKLSNGRRLKIRIDYDSKGPWVDIIED